MNVLNPLFLRQKHSDMRQKILVVDDEDTLCEVLRFNLEAEGYEVDTALSAEEALGMDLKSYNLFILDVMMGEISGFQLASVIKSSPATASIPIIFCTALDSENDEVHGLDLGADDYISKPYSVRTLIARVRSVLRRNTAENTVDGDDEALTYKGLCVLPNRKMCMVDGLEVKMPRKEFEILAVLMQHPGHIFSREDLLRRIWPEEVIVLDRVVDVNITRIRQKIGPYGRNIVTRSGYGYVFVE